MYDLDLSTNFEIVRTQGVAPGLRVEIPYLSNGRMERRHSKAKDP